MTYFCLHIGLYSPTLLKHGKNYDEVVNKLEDTIKKLFTLIQCNSFKASESKYHFFLSPSQPLTIKIKESVAESFNSEKVFDVTIDKNVPFDDHFTKLCHKTSRNFMNCPG